MKSVMVFIAGAMFLSTAFANDHGFEERYKMKMGRYTPAEEARRETARIAAKESRASQVMHCAKHGCCTNREEQTAVAKAEVPRGDPGFEERYRMKTGRFTPAQEARIEANRITAKEVVAKQVVNCAKHGCCTNREEQNALAKPDASPAEQSQAAGSELTTDDPQAGMCERDCCKPRQ